MLRMTRGRTALAPVSVADVLLDAEFFLGYVVGRTELDTAVGHLVEAGAVKETANWRLIDGRSRHGRHIHRHLSEDEFDQRRAAPDRGVWPNNRAVEVSIPSTAAGPSPSEWRRAESLAIAVCRALEAHGVPATVATIREDPGALAFDILTEADRDQGRVCRLVEPVVRARGFADASLSVLRQLP